jgi:hypothetical protein
MIYNNAFWQNKSRIQLRQATKLTKIIIMLYGLKQAFISHNHQQPYEIVFTTLFKK